MAIDTHRSFESTLASARSTMGLGEIVRLAVDSFRASKMRFALTALGMVIGSMSLILVVTIGLTGKHFIIHELQSIGTNMIDLEYAGGGGGTVSNYRTDYLRLDDMRAVEEQLPEIAAASPLLQMHDRIDVGSGVEKDILVLGVTPPYRTIRNLLVPTGRFFDDEDETTHAQVADITIPLAKLMFGSPQNAINKTFTISGIPFTIIGTFKESVDTFGESEIRDETILIPYSVARYFTGTDYVQDIFFSTRDQSDIEQTAQQIVKIVKSRHQPNSVYTATTLTSLITTAGIIANALTIILLLVAAVTLAVGGVGIMNIMLATVRSRIREIGIRKALGATAREIKLQFLIEAIFISLAGGLVGTLIGISLPLSVRLFTSYKLPISGISILVALGTSVAVGVIFGTLPANRAAQMDPVESLKYE
uniref:FtsX-like permease family protein n=1 Tax=Acidobacterium capsulatum TaxID=33075 RepID=A0A7V5CTQ6_9BACT